MQERHPIDDQFRRVLANAEAEPPASVWEGIAAAQEMRKRGAGWRWGRNASVALLGVCLTGVVAYYMTAGDSSIHASEVGAVSENRTQNVNITKERSSDAAAFLPHGRGHADKATSGTGQLHTDRTMDPDNSPSKMVNAGNAPDEYAHGSFTGADKRTSSLSTTRQNGYHSVDRSRGAEHSSLSNTPLFPDAYPVFDQPDGQVQREAVDLLSTIFRHEHIPHPARSQEPLNYVLPRGEWWLGAQWASYTARSTWKGSDEQLAAELEQGEGNTSIICWGLLAGRQWRDGFGISTGILMDGTERSFRHVDPLSTSTEEVSSYFVTLNDQVFVSNVDTIRTITTDERVTEGMERRTMLRIPVHVHWSKDLRRWSFGVRAGMALELTRTEAGPGLQRVENDIIGTTELDAATSADRYPDLLVALAGIDLGYRLHERWSIQAGYAGMQGVTSIATHGPVQAYPIRHGAELRLIFHLPSHERPCTP